MCHAITVATTAYMGRCWQICSSVCCTVVWQPRGEPQDPSPGTGEEAGSEAIRCMKTQLLTIETHLVLRLKALVPFVVHFMHVVPKADGCDRLHAVGDCMDTRLGTSSTHRMCLQ